MSIGSCILKECEARGWSVKELARRAHCKVADLNAVILGERPLRAEVGAKIDKALGTSEGFWMQLQGYLRRSTG